MAQIYPSLLAADQNNLEKIVAELEPLCAGFHIDIMDNAFVPNTGISIEKANTIAKKTFRQLWVHLMVHKPESYLDKLQLPPDTIFTFHIESHKNPQKLIEQILKKEWLPGIAIKPQTGVDALFPFLGFIHQALIMTVEPGFSGQPLLENTLTKIDPLVGFRQTDGLDFKIAVDGGVNEKNIAQIAQKRVDQIAIGSAILRAAIGPVKAYELFSKLAP